MRTVDLIADILRREGVQYLSCFPTTPVLEATAVAGIRPIISRQERVGVGIADGYSRVTWGNPMGVFAMQYGPGAENAFSGIATAYSRLNAPAHPGPGTPHGPAGYSAPVQFHDQLCRHHQVH